MRGRVTPQAMPDDCYRLLRDAAHMHANASDLEASAYRHADWHMMAKAADKRAKHHRAAVVAYGALLMGLQPSTRKR